MKKNKEVSDSVLAKGDFTVGVVGADFNKEYSESLMEFCIEGLLDCRVHEDNIEIFRVPGSFELPFAAKKLALSGKFNAIICLGIIIRGDTSHFELVSNCTARGIMQLNLESPVPVIFGVLSCENIRQTKDRLYLGEEYARTAVKMMNMNANIY